MLHTFLIPPSGHTHPVRLGMHGPHAPHRARTCTGANSVRTDSDWGKSGLLPDFFVYASGKMSALASPQKTKERQMRFTEKMIYNIKRALPVLAIAGAGLMASCDKDDEPDVPQHDVELPFTKWTADQRLTFPILWGYINDPAVRYIYLVVEGDWNNYTPDNISQTRDNFLQPRMEMSPKMRGRGDFHFTPGAASRVPSDSLWYVQQGWTINKYLQNQK